MASTVIKAGGEKVLAAGKSGTWHWNNAAPSNAVWTANAVPVQTDPAYSPTQDDSIEVTRVWRRLIVMEVKPYPQSQTAETKVEHEVYYTVKNPGTKDVRFNVFLSVAY